MSRPMAGPARSWSIFPRTSSSPRAFYHGPQNIEHKTYKPRIKGDPEKIKSAVEMMRRAKRPLFYTGGGVINSGPGASRLLRELVKLTGFPITSTLMGLGAYPASDPQWLGMLGMHGTYEANLSMHDCDLMICIGARFDDRITGRLDAFSPGSTKIHVDIDPSSINKNVKVDLAIVGDCANVLAEMVQPVARRPGGARQEAVGAPGGPRSRPGARANRSPIRTRARSSSRNTRSSGCTT